MEGKIQVSVGQGGGTCLKLVESKTGESTQQSKDFAAFFPKESVILTDRPLGRIRRPTRRRHQECLSQCSSLLVVKVSVWGGIHEQTQKAPKPAAGPARRKHYAEEY